MSDLTAKLASLGVLVSTMIGPLGQERVSGQIEWRNSGVQVDATGRIAARGESVLEPAARSPLAAVAANVGRHVVVQLDTREPIEQSPLDARQRAALEASGLRLLSYLGNRTFFASVSTNPDITALARTTALKHVEPIQTAWKTHPAFADRQVPAWAIVEEPAEDNPIVAAYVLFHRDVRLAPDGVATAQRHAAVIRSHLRSVHGLVIELPLDNIEVLAAEDIVQWIEPPLPPLDSTNDSVRWVTQVETVQTDPQYGLDGNGVTVLVYDGGRADEGHPDFGGRLSGRDDSFTNAHSTHVAGTIGGDGFASGGVWRGMAPGVTIESYGFQTSGGQGDDWLYTDPGDLEQDYDEAANLHGAVIANNSIGTNVCANGWDCEWTGDYGVTSQLIDAIVVGSLGQPFRVIWSAGNERGCERCRDEGVHTPAGYYSTAPPSGAKNHITVGAINSNDESMTPFSSWGPTDDGRLKPDLIAPGCQITDDFGVTSCSLLGSYLESCGTSMSAPAVTGAAVLLLQDFRATFPGQPDCRNATLKALLVHNALDLEQPGPDYRSGYGAIRVKDTIDFMRTGYFFEAELDHDDTRATLVRVLAADSRLKVTLAWDDAPATPNVQRALVNDLELRVYAPSGERHHCWTLDPQEPDRPAERTRPDRLNNVEQVSVDLPTPGLWLVEVYGYTVPQGPQPFSLCVSPEIPVDCDENGVPDDQQIQAQPDLDCTGNGILDTCEPDCDSDGIANSCELADATSSDCNRDGIPDDCQEWADCNTNGTYDPCDVSQGSASDCNSNWIPDACEPDCNLNGAADECDIMDGTSRDCDRDGIPDECQLMLDCNANSIFDPCETTDGLADDFNSNGIPDECEYPEAALHVDAANCPGPGIGTPSDPFCMIQDAINHAMSGDKIVVTQGTYTGPGNRNLDFGGRHIILRSTQPTDPEVVANTVIDCEAKGRGFYFHSGEGPDALLDGFTIRNGLAATGSTSGLERGAGIYCKDSHPTIRNCVLTGGAVAPTLLFLYGGAGIYCDNSSPLIDNCTITANHTYNYGGGIYCFANSNPLIRKCLITDNTGFSGAGIACGYASAPIIENSIIADNTSGPGGVGGGVAAYVGSNVTIRNSLLTGNAAGLIGGAAHAYDRVTLNIRNCTIVGNEANFAGGGIYAEVNTDTTVVNTILWDNATSAGAPQIVLTHASQLTLAFSDMAGGLSAVEVDGGSTLNWGHGNLDVDPSFVNPDDGDYGITEFSPCIDAGDPTFTPEPGEADIDGEYRVGHCRIDIGADESPFFTDCNSNELADACEVADGAAEDCDANAVPDDCQDTTADCNENGVWDWCDIADGAADDCDADGIPDDCAIADGTVPDCNENGIPDSCDIANGRVNDTIVTDVNDNGIPDSCEFCQDDDECSDGLYCTGTEYCAAGLCLPGADPCPGQVCAEESQTCHDCLTDDDCDDGNECTSNICDDGECFVDYVTGPCDDGEPCTEDDACVQGQCIGTVIPGCSATYSIRAVALNSVPIPDGPVDELTIHSGDSVTCEIFVEGWGPETLRSYQVMIDPAGYTSAPRGSLAPLTDPNPSAGAFIDHSRFDYVFFDLPAITIVWNQDPATYRYAGLALFSQDCVVDLETPAYLGTLILTATLDASGTFTMCLDDSDTNADLDPDNSFLRDCNSVSITPIDFQCLTINSVADCNDNGIPDDEDIADGTSEDCTENGIPDECEPDCDQNGVADSCDIADGTSQDCNANGVPDSCDIDEGASDDCDDNGVPDECQPDCNENGVADSCDIADGTSGDCNSNGVPDECEDCNGNGFADECDLDDGTSLDCNGNLVPDECDIADGTSRDCDTNEVPDECQDTSDDCNENGVWDRCDIFDDTSDDCNYNDHPDECDIFEGTSTDCDRNNLPDECPDYLPHLLEVSELDQLSGLVIHGIDAGDNAGRSVSTAGDINADGITDILIRASEADPGGLGEAGEVYVIFGRSEPWESPFELLALLPEGGGDGRDGFVIAGIEADDYAGSSVSSAGDYNGDGIDDIVIGAVGAGSRENDSTGRAYVLFGHPTIGAEAVVSLADLNGINGFTINGINENDLTGGQVALAGDVNGDGLDDILISAHLASANGQEYAGRAYVLFGRADPWSESFDLSNLLPQNGGDGTGGFVINGIDPGDMAGFAVAGAGDVNDDGFPDMVVGAHAADANDLIYVGQAYVIFGGPTVGVPGELNLADLDGGNGFIINGIDEADLAGHTVSTAGDLNDDGIADLLVGAVWADPNGDNEAGETYVVFGHPDPWPGVFELSSLLPENGGDGTVGSIINGVNARDFSGFAASYAGDVDSDGIGDLIIGAYAADSDEHEDVGEAYVLFGHPDPWPPMFELASLFDDDQPPPLGFVIREAHPGAAFARSVAAAGDVNNDGTDDLVIGAPHASPEERESAGKTYIVFGRHVLPRDCNDNGILDHCDILDGISEDCNGDFIPDECQDSSDDCNGNGVWDLCDLLDGTSQDCNSNAVPDECDLATGDSEDCNENGIPDECETTDPQDCNENGIWDECDIYTGASGDCNANAIPDECESGGTEDCNGNGRPDLCDIYDGTSKDMNVNFIPDECEPHQLIYVSATDCNQQTGGTGSETDPFCRIQDAIDAAGNGATEVIEVIVANGVYSGPGNRALDIGNNLPNDESRSITIRAEGGPANCLIDCAPDPNIPGDPGAGHAFLFHRGETPGTRVEGFTILGASYGAIECTGDSNPIIRNCVITRNLRNGGGAGIKCIHSSPTISHCIIAGNYVNAITCVDQSSPTIVNCVIVGNSSASGSGIHCSYQSNPQISQCTIARNAASEEEGGAVYSYLSLPMVTNSVLWNNAANELAGSVYVTYSDVRGDWPGRGNIDDDPLFFGLYMGIWTADGQYDPQTHQITLTDATASWEDGELVGLTVKPIVDIPLEFEFVIIANTATTLTAWGDMWGLAVVGFEYEIFAYHLAAGSPCANAGEFGLQIAAEETDIEGQERIKHCRIDMGAYESPYHKDCNENSFPDACEALEGTAEDCDVNGVPDECEPDCNENDVTDACDILSETSEDKDHNGIPDECEPAPCDLNRDGRVDDTDVEIMRMCRRWQQPDGDPACEVADFDSDGQITDEDWLIFSRCYRKIGLGIGYPWYGTDDWPPRSLRSGW